MDGGVAILDVDWLDGRRHAVVYCEVVGGQNTIISKVIIFYLYFSTHGNNLQYS